MKAIVQFFLVLSLMGQVVASDSWPLNDYTEIEINKVINNVLNNFKNEISALNVPVKVNYKHADYIPESSISSAANVSSSTVWNESTQTYSPVIHLNFTGVFLRFKSLNLDGVAIIVCHELGHVIGGSPNYGINPELGWGWSAEGQADYFAASKCFKKYALSNPSKISSVDPIVKNKCQSEFKKSAINKDICIRSAMAGLGVITTLNLVAYLSTDESIRDFSFYSPSELDPPDSGSTLIRHPDYQCRLDTYFAGALCGDKATCEETQNRRPQCWYVDDPLA